MLHLAIAASARGAGRSRRPAIKSDFALATCRTAIAIEHIAVIALFTIGLIAVTTGLRDTALPRSRTQIPGIDLALSAAVAINLIAVIALLKASADNAVTIHV